MIENPFEFGRAVEDEYFTDRINDAKHLEANLTHGINTIIISPRRWGKTSLVKKVISQSKRKDVKFIFIDVFSCKSDYEFCKMLATETIRQTSSRWDEWVQMAKTFLSNITPKFSFGTDPMNDFSLSFAWNPKDNPEREILQLQDLPFRVILWIPGKRQGKVVHRISTEGELWSNVGKKGFCHLNPFVPSGRCLTDGFRCQHLAKLIVGFA